MKKIIIFHIFFLLLVMLFPTNLRDRAREHRAKAEEYLAKDDFENALEQFKRVVSLAPEMRSDIEEDLITSQLKLAISIVDKDTKRSISLLRDLIYNYKNYPRSYFHLGYIFEKGDDFENAEKSYNDFLNYEKQDIVKIQQVQSKLKEWETDRKSYSDGVKYMASGDFQRALDEFQKVRQINRARAEEFINQLIGVIDVKPATPVPVRTGIDRTRILSELKKAIEAKDINSLDILLSPNYMSSIGNKENYMAFWRDFWFLFFQNLTYEYSQVKETKISDNEYFLAFNFILSAIYSGKDMSLFKTEFKFGNRYTWNGTAMFLIRRTDNVWNIVQ